MAKLQGKQINRMAVLFAITYMISYITRINYGAIILEMETATGFSKDLLSMALTGSFITYGVGQVISGLIGDRVSPKKLVSIGLCTTIATNLLIPFCPDPYAMLAVWCVNGFAQSLMWPPLVRLMSTLLSPEDYKKVTTRVSWGSSFGTIAVYLFSPLLIWLLGWKSVFFFSAGCGLIMFFIWNRFSYDVQPQKPTDAPSAGKQNLRPLFTPLMLGIMAAIILQGMLRDGVTTWMPTYIKETYQLDSVIAILTGVILPLFSILSFQIASRLYIKKFTTPLTCAALFFGVGMVSAIGLRLLNGQHAAFSIFFSALLTGCMHGVNLMLICMIPPFFAKYGIVSTVSGVMNSCTYIGSAVSTYAIAVLSENLGWDFTLLTWLLIALAGTGICLLCIRPWRKKCQS